ncbi:hypothetical protein [Verrucomicrobium sp. BvORR106]|uniref:hypothetical protein n=1 Tax=Verrucomicrobium sp. BvORR106 TaxID=1403819 RepID=UPI00056DF3F6|nr:hypothetical protein [Verrucomicrobium sp. BvORR106]
MAIDIAAGTMMFAHTMSSRLCGLLLDLLARVKQIALAWLFGAVVTLSAGFDVHSWRDFQKAGLIWLWGLLYPLLVGAACAGLFVASARTVGYLLDLKRRHDVDLGVPTDRPASASSTVCTVLSVVSGSVAGVYLSRYLGDGALRLLLLVL